MLCYILDEELRSLLSPIAEIRLVIGRVASHNRDGVRSVIMPHRSMRTG
jgi:hypothetical protein